MPADARAMPAPTKRGVFRMPADARAEETLVFRMPADAGGLAAPTKRGSCGCPRMSARCPRPRNVGVPDARGCPRPGNVGVADARGSTDARTRPMDARGHETWATPMPARGRWMPAPTKRGQKRCPHEVHGCPRPRLLGKGDARTCRMGARAHETWAKTMPAPGRWMPAPTERGHRRCPHLPARCPRPGNVGKNDGPHSSVR